jgi:hypothetical protein
LQNATFKYGNKISLLATTMPLAPPRVVSLGRILWLEILYIFVCQATYLASTAMLASGRCVVFLFITIAIGY